MTRKRRKEYQRIHLQCHSHKDFRSQEEKNGFINFWIFQENRNKYPICRGDQPNASLCKIPEGDTEQEKKDN